ncbi:trypsin-like peptidase domain-containing protein [Pararhizobium gei]|uniref:trypsin-like peptidase domain-containing protein n=1 Tax=Pararhizobium gei TaxID=1395951 RepID=UPI0023DC70F3|nr:phospholipase D-like domain-containing protein [Rhizobium gei]
MAKKKLFLTVPKAFENARAQVSILAHDLTVVRSTTLREAAGGIELEPGVYAARAVLADGNVLQAAFKLYKTTKQEVVELVAMPTSQSGLHAVSSRVFATSSAARNSLALEGVAASYAPGSSALVEADMTSESVASVEAPSLSLVNLGLEGVVSESAEPVTLDPAGKVQMSAQAGIRFVKAHYQTGDLLVAVPTSHGESATLSFTPGDPDVHVDLEDDDADLLLAYLGTRQLEQLSQLIGGYWERSRDLLEGKRIRPVAAAVGAYVSVLVGSPDLSEADCLSEDNWLNRWTNNLFKDFPWLVDGLCIRAEILARRGEHEEAIRLFCMLSERGLPMFTFGFRFAIDRLGGYRNAAEKGLLRQDHLASIEAVLTPLKRLAATVDFRRPVLSFWHAAPTHQREEERQLPVPSIRTTATTAVISQITRSQPMDEAVERQRRKNARTTRNEEFVQRLFARHPDASAHYKAELESASLESDVALESVASAAPATTGRELMLETIVRKERPVLFVRDDWLDIENVTTFGLEAEELVRDLNARRNILKPLMPLVGRIDVTSFPGAEFLGTAWFVDVDIVVTNRHVAELIARWDGRRYAFSRGIGGTITASVNTLHEFDDLAGDAARSFAVEEVLYIERDPAVDIAFLKVRRRTDGARLDRITIASSDAEPDTSVVTVGYPARASKRVIPDQDLMEQLYRGRFDIKRAAPGLAMPRDGASWRHDCTTLGGASGSPVFDPRTGTAVGLHFAGLYEEANFAVPATILRDYVTKRRWTKPPEIETTQPAKPAASLQTLTPVSPVQATTPGGLTVGSTGGSVSVTIPLTINFSLGQPMANVTVAAMPAVSVGPTDDGGATMDAESAVKAFWAARPEGVIAARVGFRSVGGAIGEQPYIAAAAPADRLADVADRGPVRFAGYEVRYEPANATEIIDGMALTESVDAISYDDSARTGAAFSFDQVDEEMTVRAHVGPEYSWDELKAFLSDGRGGDLVSAIYEFHAPQIKDVLEARLVAGASLTLVCDNVTYSPVKNPKEEFERIEVFNDWNNRFRRRFQRMVPPEGRNGLISDAYHIKVTVKQDDSFWLSSGNWKAGSSQPVISDAQRDNAARVDLPGNREWHVVIDNATLADRFRSHILQDFQRSKDLGGSEQPRQREASDAFIEVALDQQILEERPPASRLLKPKTFSGRVRAKPLLTPDQEGAVYSEAVLELIGSATDNLLFQIPYISMPSNPDADRGFIDTLLQALTDKLLTLRDARLILRSGGSKFSAPTHAAWFFKSKGVDIDNRVRQIENHHTKGMIVDGKRVLIGSHNWSKPGVTLNRDASLLFDNTPIASYFAEAFEIDWQRGSRIRPREFRRESILEAAAGATPPGLMRVSLSALLKDED